MPFFELTSAEATLNSTPLTEEDYLAFTFLISQEYFREQKLLRRGIVARLRPMWLNSPHEIALP